MRGVVHWDEVDGLRRDVGPMHLVRIDLGRAAGTRDVGLARLQVDSGAQSSAVHLHGDEEEIFFVLGGSALLWQGGKTCEIRAGDFIVHLSAGEPHVLVAGTDGLDVLVFGERMRSSVSFLPRAGVVSTRFGVLLGGADERHPWEAEAETGPLDLPNPGPRPANVVNLDDVEGAYGGLAKDLGIAAASERTGLNWVSLPAGEEGAPPHCHSLEEEIFVVLDGDGVLELWPSPQAARVNPDAAREDHPVRAGHVISRPPATRVGHSFRAGPSGLTYLAYGTREPNDIAYYPRSNKIFFRGVGLIARLENLDYFDGEPS